jgi:hypothetical protein
VLQSTQRLVEQYWQYGGFELAKGSLERSRAALVEALAQAEAGGLEDAATVTRAYMAYCDSELGDQEAAARFVIHATEAFQNPDIRALGAVRQRMLVFRAVLDAGRGDLGGTARALGAVHAIEDSGMALDWTLTGLRDRTLQRARSELGEAAAEAAFEAGRRLGLDGVIALVTAV